MSDLTACLAELSSTVAHLADRHGLATSPPSPRSAATGGEVFRALDKLEDAAADLSSRTRRYHASAAEQVLQDSELQATIECQLRAFNDITNLVARGMEDRAASDGMDAFAGVKFMHHRRAAPCPHCGGLFFPVSLKIHEEQCAARWAEAEGHASSSRRSQHARDTSRRAAAASKAVDEANCAIARGRAGPKKKTTTATTRPQLQRAVSLCAANEVPDDEVQPQAGRIEVRDIVVRRRSPDAHTHTDEKTVSKRLERDGEGHLDFQPVSKEEVQSADSHCAFLTFGERVRRRMGLDECVRGLAALGPCRETSGKEAAAGLEATSPDASCLQASPMQEPRSCEASRLDRSACSDSVSGCAPCDASEDLEGDWAQEEVLPVVASSGPLPPAASFLQQDPIHTRSSAGPLPAVTSRESLHENDLQNAENGLEKSSIAEREHLKSTSRCKQRSQSEPALSREFDLQTEVRGKSKLKFCSKQSTVMKKETAISRSGSRGSGPRLQRRAASSGTRTASKRKSQTTAKQRQPAQTKHRSLGRHREDQNTKQKSIISQTAQRHHGEEFSTIDRDAASDDGALAHADKSTLSIAATPEVRVFEAVGMSPVKQLNPRKLQRVPRSWQILSPLQVLQAPEEWLADEAASQKASCAGCMPCASLTHGAHKEQRVAPMARTPEAREQKCSSFSSPGSGHLPEEILKAPRVLAVDVTRQPRQRQPRCTPCRKGPKPWC
eukprot:TRINITY_DN28124_c0_g1_i1.p1 TRINITY_DN28124_c0_g1~~TRINITY_DN28124_c0_g1_i1.p1  ORF type:complete len:738 (+),score=150.92 TRINITY_DN28124_c0_g1_i1:45-2216(+)